ncbi:hypothetical protein CsSME_00031061 [Camellia sinensis var. sinensis]
MAIFKQSRDSNWARDVSNRQSTSGFCIFLHSNLVSWSAKKQNTVSCSSTEAKYRSLAHTAVELCWLQQFLTDLFVPSSVPVLWCDNQSTIALASNPVLHSRSKHIEIDCNFVREKSKLLMQPCPIRLTEDDKNTKESHTLAQGLKQSHLKCSQQAKELTVNVSQLSKVNKFKHQSCKLYGS